jgi:hypothetical protein
MTERHTGPRRGRLSISLLAGVVGLLGVLPALAAGAPSLGALSTSAVASPVTQHRAAPLAGVSARSAGAGAPRAVCGTAQLDGPASKPAGARKVSTSQSLQRLTARAPAGTTFWLEPGRHIIPGGAFDQVQPKNGNVYIGAPGAVLDGRRVNRYAFSSSAHDVRISHLTIENFGQSVQDNPGETVVNSGSGNDWVVDHSTIQQNAGAGVFLADGSRVVRNCLRDNGEYGFAAHESNGPAHDVVLRGNEIVGNNTADWENLQPGCGCAGGGKFWDTRGARVVDNYVHDNHGPGLWADTDNVGFLFEGNYIANNDDVGLFYEISYNALIRRNTFVRNGWKIGLESLDGTPAIYISESGSDQRAGSLYGRHLRISGNLFVDNWSGIMAWEHPGRFAGSPYNVSADYSTLVNPGVATVARCGDPDLIGTAPYIDDCRWKTQHLRVVRNTFEFDPTKIPGCTVEHGCGFMSLVSTYGTVPEWAPYLKYVVPDAISLAQDNVWRANAYHGPWRFMIRLLGPQVSWSTWRSAPYHQDAGSTRS